MSEVNIPLKRKQREGGKAKSYKSNSNQQGNKHAQKKGATPAEKQRQYDRARPMVKGLIGSMKLTKIPLSVWESMPHTRPVS